jgi:glycerol-3-phosphate cytidylyltransferase
MRLIPVPDLGEHGPPPTPALIGYTAGVFDMFHVGHLNLLRHAHDRCEFLIVGVTTDELAHAQKGERPVIPLLERMAIVQHVRYVDHVVVQASMDKLAAWEVLKFDVLFVGDNMRGATSWAAVEQELAAVGVRVVYLPATHTQPGRLLSRGLRDLVSD